MQGPGADLPRALPLDKEAPWAIPGDTLHMWLLTLHPQILAELEALVQTGKLPKRRR